jgi:hypothetical protein
MMPHEPLTAPSPESSPRTVVPNVTNRAVTAVNGLCKSSSAGSGIYERANMKSATGANAKATRIGNARDCTKPGLSGTVRRRLDRQEGTSHLTRTVG